MPTINQKGQGLIEALIAIAVILTAVVGGLSLMVSSFAAGEQSANRIIASNLAREAVEIARNFRDSAWLGGEAFDSWLINPELDYSAVPYYDEVAGHWNFNFLPDDITHENCDVYIVEDGDMAGLLNNSALGQKTIFKRIVMLNPICWDPVDKEESIAAESDTCIAPLEAIGISVSAQVNWQESRGGHTVTAQEKLYNWRWR